MKTVKVYHDYYGCDTGCCGHRIEVDGVERFTFGHKWSEDEESDVEWAQEEARKLLGKEHCQDLDWDNAEIELSDD